MYIYVGRIYVDVYIQGGWSVLDIKQLRTGTGAMLWKPVLRNDYERVASLCAEGTETASTGYAAHRYIHTKPSSLTFRKTHKEISEGPNLATKRSIKSSYKLSYEFFATLYCIIFLIA